jgi:DNA mismatch repair protein MutS2
MYRKGPVDLIQAKNPILLNLANEGSSVVPADVFLDDTVNVMIISGPNRGGKTVTLKTVGLLCLMAQAGIHIPAAEGSSLPVFRNIMAEIGDDQDIQAGLSTFSAHVNHLKYMMQHADQESLVIIDEPRMGTDPDEGAALAMAVLDSLSRKGTLVAVSTHYNRLKTYGLLNEKAKNTCMEFDASSNRPTFTLRYGTPGTSYAFEIAHDSGIPSEVLDRAKGYLHQDEIRLNRLIDKRNRLIRETERERMDVERLRRQYHSAREKMVKALVKLESEKKAFLEKKANEVEHLIKGAREEFKELINSLKKKKQSSQAYVKEKYDQIGNNLREKLLLEAEKGKSAEVDDLKVGQLARHKRHHQMGTIISLDHEHSRALIMAGNVKLSVNLRDLEIVPGKEKPEQEESTRITPYHFLCNSDGEINLIGYRVADALPLLDKMIDSAMVEGKPSLKIIHGYGTGRLREAIREHLRRFSCVKSVSGADLRSGGDAITVVELQ